MIKHRRLYCNCLVRIGICFIFQDIWVYLSIIFNNQVQCRVQILYLKWKAESSCGKFLVSTSVMKLQHSLHGFEISIQFTHFKKFSDPFILEPLCPVRSLSTLKCWDCKSNQWTLLLICFGSTKSRNLFIELNYIKRKQNLLMEGYQFFNEPRLGSTTPTQKRTLSLEVQIPSNEPRLWWSHVRRPLKVKFIWNFLVKVLYAQKYYQV